MGQTTSLARLVGDDKDSAWTYRFRANPRMPRGSNPPPAPVLAPGSALGSRPAFSYSSDQVLRVYPSSGAQGNPPAVDWGPVPWLLPPGLGRQLISPVSPDLLHSTRLLTYE